MDKFLKKFAGQIIEKVSANSVLDLLWYNSIITFDEKNCIRDLSTSENRRKLVECLITKDFCHVKTFVQILKDSTAGQESIVSSMGEYLAKTDEHGESIIISTTKTSVSSSVAVNGSATTKSSTTVSTCSMKSELGDGDDDAKFSAGDIILLNLSEFALFPLLWI